MSRDDDLTGDSNSIINQKKLLEDYAREQGFTNYVHFTDDGWSRPDLYTALVASEKLYEHCAEIDAAAQSRIDLIMPELAKSAGATEELKAKDQLAWVGLMNAYKAQAEEIVKHELIYD